VGLECVWGLLQPGLLHKTTLTTGGDIPIDVATNQNIGGDKSPASPAGVTPMIVSFSFVVGVCDYAPFR